MFESRYRLKITGPHPQNFLQKIISLHYPLLEIKKEDKTLFLLVNEKVYQALKKQKTIYEIEIVERYGIAKFKYLFKKYSLFLGAILVSFLLLKFLSSLILKVEVIHTNASLRELVRTDLEEFGLAPYHFKVSFSEKEKIKEKILAKEKNRIEWLEIEEKGTTYVVNVEERKKNVDKKITEEQHIVAKKAGRILSITAERGEVVRKKNDYVQKGDVLISGIIKNKETPVSKVRAEGSVYAEVWYRVHVSVPYSYQEKVLTGNKKHRFEINFLSHHIPLFDFFRYDQSQKVRKKLWESTLLPINLSYTTYQEVKIKQDVHNEIEAYSLALKLAKEKLKKKLGSDDTIISQKTLKKSHKNSRIIVDMFFKVKEDITDTVSLKNVKLEDLQKELEKEE